MLDNKTVNGFIQELASNSPAPGGGSVAALSASIGAALSSMVFNLTVGKKVYREYDETNQKRVDTSLDESLKIKDEFLQLMNKDTEEFLELMKAFKLPKESEEEKAFRKEKIQEGYIRALKVPLEVAERAFDMYTYIKTACELGNKNAISDAGVAALMIQAGIESAVLNVKINLGAVKDEEYKEKVLNKCNELVIKGKENCEEVLRVVNEKI